jgi:hypothetical protein
MGQKKNLLTNLLRSTKRNLKGRTGQIQTAPYLAGDEEVIVARGGSNGGYTLFMKEDEVWFEFDCHALESIRLGSGKLNRLFDFVERGSLKKGVPGRVRRLFVNPDEDDEVELAGMHISTFSCPEAMKVEIDASTAAFDTYRVKNPFSFT